MKRLTALFLAGLVFVFNIINMSGFGAAYHTEQYTRLLLLAFTAVLILFREKRAILLDRRIFLCVIGVAVTFGLSAVMSGTLQQAYAALTCFLLTYIFSKFRINDTAMRLIGWMLLIGAYSLLLIYEKTTWISGWNPNAIAMLSFFSFIVYMATAMFSPIWKERLAAIIVSIGYIALLLETDARSSAICALLSILIAMFPAKSEWLPCSRGIRQVVLHEALLLVIAVVLLYKSPFFQGLDTWSLEIFGKPIFNGRETTWGLGIQIFLSHVLLGSGKLNIENWHNWALSLMTAYGLLGYLSWTGLVECLLEKSVPYLRDSMVLGCVTSFLLILLQQSVELGLIGYQNVHLIPYMLLGLMFGRIRYLRTRGDKNCDFS